MRRILALVFLVAPLAGCSGGGDLSKTDDATLRNNFARSLTPEEIKKLQSGPPSAVSGPPTKPNP